MPLGCTAAALKTLLTSCRPDLYGKGLRAAAAACPIIGSYAKRKDNTSQDVLRRQTDEKLCKIKVLLKVRSVESGSQSEGEEDRRYHHPL